MHKFCLFCLKNPKSVNIKEQNTLTVNKEKWQTIPSMFDEIRKRFTNIIISNGNIYKEN